MAKKSTKLQAVSSLLSDIIMIAFFAVLGNANEWGDIETYITEDISWFKDKKEWIKQEQRICNS